MVLILLARFGRLIIINYLSADVCPGPPEAVYKVGVDVLVVFVVGGAFVAEPDSGVVV